MEVLILVLVILWLVVGAYVASAFQEVAEEKGFGNSRKYFWLTFLLGIVGMLLVVALRLLAEILFAFPI